MQVLWDIHTNEQVSFWLLGQCIVPYEMSYLLS